MTRLATQGLPSPPLIWPAGRLSLGSTISRASANPVSGISPWSDAANCLLGVPFQLEAPRTTFYKGWWFGGTAPGSNTEVGIWDEAYSNLTTTGSVLGSVTSAPQAAALTTTLTLGPGRYYMGIAHNATTTNQFVRWSIATLGIPLWQGLGCWRQAAITLGSLGATATPGDISNIAMPLFGLITRTVMDI